MLLSPGRPRRPRRLLATLAVVATAAVATTALALPAEARSRPDTGPRDPHASKDRLDQKSRTAPDNVEAWYVDESTGQVVVKVAGPPTPASSAFAADPADPAAVRQEPFSEPVRPLASLVGGNPIYNSRVRCSLGFDVTRGTTRMVVTAGHCTASGGPWSGYSRVPIGPVTRTAWPTRDYGAITVTNTAAWQSTPQIAFGPSVRGSREAPVGAQVCRSGSTSGYRCGVITAKNVTVNYGNGQLVYGLTRTTMCAEPGDSGGSVISPRDAQAQGLTSGGNGNCTAGGTTYFQPINPVLSALGARLVVT